MVTLGFRSSNAVGCGGRPSLEGTVHLISASGGRLSDVFIYVALPVCIAQQVMHFGGLELPDLRFLRVPGLQYTSRYVYYEAC